MVGRGAEKVKGMSTIEMIALGVGVMWGLIVVAILIEVLHRIINRIWS